MSPRGKVLDEEKVRELACEKELVILCGHYEGVDQRVLDYFGAEEVSIGDYILTGGELPAMVLIDSVARMIDGVLASEEAALGESIYSGLLELSLIHILKAAGRLERIGATKNGSWQVIEI